MAQKTIYLESEELYRVMELLYLRLGELMVTLAPEGWNNSPYHFPFVPIAEELEVQYKNYEVVAQAYERQFGQHLAAYLKRGRESVNMPCEEIPPYKNTAELIYLIEFALTQLGENGLLFKKSTPHLLYFIDESTVEEVSFDISIEHSHLDTFNFSAFSINRARHELLYHIDLSVLYTEIFASFAQLNYDWRYCSTALENLWLKCRLSELGQLDNCSEKQQIHLDNLYQEIARHDRKLPPDEIIGYICTYDKLPIGYPPTLTDITNLVRDT